MDYDKEARVFKPSEKFNAFELGTFIHNIFEHVNRLRLRVVRGRKVPFNYTVTDNVLINIGLKRIQRCKAFKPEDKLFHTAKWVECYAEVKKQERFLKPLGAEVGFSKVIYEDNDVCFIYEGRIDYIGRNDPAGVLSWVDYKTQSKDYVLYENPNQFIGYSWVLGTNLGFVQYYGLQSGNKNAGMAEIQREREKAFRLEPIYHNPKVQTFREIASLLPFGELAFRRNRAACTSGFSGVCSFVPRCDNAWAGVEVLNGITRMRYRREEWHPWRTTNGTK
jgi:hypothetical protein